MSKVYLFSADWCSGCKLLKPELERIKGAEYEILDADDPTVQEKMKELGIRALPSLVRVRYDRRKGGDVVQDILIGNRHPRAAFEKFFEVK